MILKRVRTKTGLHVSWDQGMSGKLWKSGREESLHSEALGGGGAGNGLPGRDQSSGKTLWMCGKTAQSCRPSLAAT